MRLKGFFVSCKERVFDKHDGTQGKAIECRFQVAGERDIIRLSTWSSRGVEWCKENGITTGAAGEVNVRFGDNNYGWYEQVILGFKTQAQIEVEEAERAAKAQAVAPQDKTPEMEEAAQAKMEAAQAAAAEAQANGEGTDLPF